MTVHEFLDCRSRFSYRFDVLSALDERTHVIGRTYVCGGLPGTDVSGLIDGMTAGALTLIPKSAVEPGGDNRSFAGGPVGVIAVTGLFREPVVDAIYVRERFERIYQILDESVLTGYAARPSVTGVIVYA